MTPEEIEDLAYRGGPMPDLRSAADVLLFQSFRNLYDFARRSGMQPEQGRREKAQILDNYRAFRVLEALQESTNDMWKRIDIASCEYRKAPSIAAADKLMEAIYRVKRKE